MRERCSLQIVPLQSVLQIVPVNILQVRTSFSWLIEPTEGRVYEHLLLDPSSCSTRDSYYWSHYTGSINYFKRDPPRSSPFQMQERFSIHWKKASRTWLSSSIELYMWCLNNGGKQRQAWLNGKKYVQKSVPKVLKKSVLNEIKKKYSKDDPPSFRKASSKLKVSKSSINRAAPVNFNMKKAFKKKVNYLREYNMKNRKTNARKYMKKF